MESKKVYISYAKEDQELANRLYEDIQRHGIQPWLDKRDLQPGQNWEIEIKKAIKESSIFIALLSTKSITKKGFIQKELRIAMQELDERPTADIFVIPVRIDECMPDDEKLKYLHWIDLFPSYEEGLQRIIRVINPFVSPKQYRDWDRA